MLAAGEPASTVPTSDPRKRLERRGLVHRQRGQRRENELRLRKLELLRLEREARVPADRGAPVPCQVLFRDQRHERERIREREPAELARRKLGVEQLPGLDRALKAAAAARRRWRLSGRRCASRRRSNAVATFILLPADMLLPARVRNPITMRAKTPADTQNESPKPGVAGSSPVAPVAEDASPGLRSVLGAFERWLAPPPKGTPES